MRRWFGFAAMLLLASPQAAAAVETIIVTATHMTQPVGNAAFSAVTLDADQLLRETASTTRWSRCRAFRSSAAPPAISANATTQGVSLRAIAPSGAGRALVLLDGVPVNDPFGGWVIWTALPSEDIGGAEIVRGAGAGPYGAGALTGTILLTERDDERWHRHRRCIGGKPRHLCARRHRAAIEIGDVDLFASTVRRALRWLDSRAPAAARRRRQSSVVRRRLGVAARANDARQCRPPPRASALTTRRKARGL